MNLLKKLFRDEEGATMIEYALLAALISIVAIASIILVGNQVNRVFAKVAAELVKVPQ